MVRESIIMHPLITLYIVLLCKVDLEDLNIGCLQSSESPSRNRVIIDY